MSASTLLRICTAGSVDDGKSTLIGRLLYDSQSVLRGSAAVGREGVEEPVGRADRLLALHRRPARRARAGHHDRRRVSLLRDGQAQVHPGRHARATSSTRATWRRGPRRPTSRFCSWTRGTAFSTSRGATRASRGCSASRDFVLAVNKMDLVDFDRAVFDEHRDRVRDDSGRRVDASHSDERAPRRQRHRAERHARRGSRARPARAPRDGRGRRAQARSGRCGCPCSWSFGPTRISGATAGRFSRARFAWATRSRRGRRCGPAASSGW